MYLTPIPSWNWARNRFLESEDREGSWGDLHGWSKFFGGNGIVALYSLGPTAIKQTIAGIGSRFTRAAGSSSASLINQVAPSSAAMTAEAKLAARTMTKAEWKAFNRAERLGRTAESWTTTRQNTWKAIAESELANPTGQYSRANIRRMVEGLAPKVRAEVTSNKTGLTTVREISMELHHRSLPQRFRTPTANERWNLEPVYPWSHQGMDPFRHTGYQLERIINGTNSF